MSDVQSSTAEIDALSYRLIKSGILRTQLWCARHGFLDLDWRTQLLDALADPIEGLDECQQQRRCKAAEEVANLPGAAWEPEMKVGWRQSLEAWREATQSCIEDMYKAEREIHRAAGLGTDGLDATYAMDCELETASYRAGLTAAGLVCDWEGWLRQRVLAWPAGPRRDSQLTTMATVLHRRHLQRLPRYWA
jgi:hypothetical protein